MSNLENGSESVGGGAADPNDESGKVTGGKARSETQYPYYGLGRALSIVEAVRRAGGSEAPNAAVLAELKVSKTDRLWAYGIPTAIQFGLIERVGRGDEGKIRITDLAHQILLPSSPDEAPTAKVAAVRIPKLYAVLIDRFAGHPVPAKENLRNLLHREFKIVESMASGAAEAFLDSLKDAGLVTTANTVAGGGGVAVADAKAGAANSTPPVEHDVPSDSQTIHVPADYIVYRCKIAGGRIIDLPLPPDFKKADVKRLKAFLDTQVDDADEDDDMPSGKEERPF